MSVTECTSYTQGGVPSAECNAGVWVVRTAGNAGDDSYSVTNTLAPIIRLG